MAITVINRGRVVQSIRLYRVECYSCRTVFDCESPDWKTAKFAQVKVIDCPVCNKELCEADRKDITDEANSGTN